MKFNSAQLCRQSQLSVPVTLADYSLAINAYGEKGVRGGDELEDGLDDSFGINWCWHY